MRGLRGFIVGDLPPTYPRPPYDPPSVFNVFARSWLLRSAAAWWKNSEHLSRQGTAVVSSLQPIPSSALSLPSTRHPPSSSQLASVQLRRRSRRVSSLESCPLPFLDSL